MIDAVASLGFGTASKPFVDITGGVLGGMIDNAIMHIKYENNTTLMSLLPTPGDAYWAYLSGYMSETNWQYIQAFNNVPPVNADGNPMIKFGAKSWKSVFDSKIPQLSIEQILYALYSRIIDGKQAGKLLKHYGFRESHFDILSKMMRPKYDFTTNTANFYRGNWDEVKILDNFQRIYGCGPENAKDILNSTQFLPPPGDLLRFAVRDVYNENVVQEQGLDDEYDEIKDIIPWARAQGILTDAQIKYGNKTIIRDIIRDYWRAHWNLISPQQAYEGFHRIRASRLDRFDKRITGLKEFGWEQLNLLLKMSDYLPEQRKVLAAISTKQLGRIDLRRIYNDGVIDDNELKEQYLDLGYNDTDAGYLLQWSKQSKEDKEKKEQDKKNKQAYGNLISEIYKAYEVGSLSLPNAYNRLLAYDVDPDEAQAKLDAISMKILRGRVQEYIKMVKGEFFLGLYTGQEAYIELVQGGVIDIRANNYVIRWQRQLDRPRRLASTNTVISWLKDGIISFLDAQKRLTNLGFSNADTLLYLESANMDIQKRIQIEQIKQAKTDRQRAKEIEALEKQFRAAKRQAISDLKAYSPLSAMGRWVQEGILTPQSAIERMTFMEIPNEDQQRYLAEWLGVV